MSARKEQEILKEKQQKPQQNLNGQILAVLQDILIIDLMKLQIPNKDIRSIVRVDQSRVDAISKLVKSKIQADHL